MKKGGREKKRGECRGREERRKEGKRKEDKRKEDNTKWDWGKRMEGRGKVWK